MMIASKGHRSWHVSAPYSDAHHFAFFSLFPLIFHAASLSFHPSSLLLPAYPAPLLLYRA